MTVTTLSVVGSGWVDTVAYRELSAHQSGMFPKLPLIDLLELLEVSSRVCLTTRNGVELLDDSTPNTTNRSVGGIYMSAQIIAVCNQKGGVGKTTVTAGLAEVLSHRLGKRVLLIDVDPQFNATSTLGVNEAEFTLNDVMAGGEGGEIIPGIMADAAVHAGSDWQADAGKGQEWPTMHLVSSERALAGREQDQMMGREHRLRIALDGATEGYDVILLDCPPSLGQLTINALVAADAALLVTEPRAASVEGLAEIVKTLGSVRQLFNPGLALAGIIVNKVNKRKVDQAYWIGRLESDYGPQLLPPYLPEREAFAKANSAAVPLRNYGPAGRELLDSLEVIARTIMKEQ